MKIIIAILALLLTGLGVAYLSLFLDNQQLQDELQQLTQQQTATQASNVTADIIQPQAAITYPIHPTATLHNEPSNNTPLAAADKLQRENFLNLIEQKYAILLHTLSLSNPDQEKMRALLLDRERVLNSNSVGYFTSDADIKENIKKQQAMVAEIDKQIAQLLKPDDVKKYELLKDSAYEQFQMNNFYEHLDNKNNLSDDKKTTLLLSKLEQKQAFSKLLETSAEDINRAAPEQKAFLAGKIREALHDYKDNYLRTAKANLTEEQFSALREYEQKQFDEIWHSLAAGWQTE